MAKISALQRQFLGKLFGSCQGNMAKAAKELEIDDYNILLTDELVEEIKSLADKQLAINIPRATYVIQKMLENEDGMFVQEKLHKVAIDILDRAGLSKQERPQSGNTNVGLIFLPNKLPLSEPPLTLENDTAQQFLPV